MELNFLAFSFLKTHFIYFNTLLYKTLNINGSIIFSISFKYSFLSFFILSLFFIYFSLSSSLISLPPQANPPNLSSPIVTHHKPTNHTTIAKTNTTRPLILKTEKERERDKGRTHPHRLTHHHEPKPYHLFNFNWVTTTSHSVRTCNIL